MTYHNEAERHTADYGSDDCGVAAIDEAIIVTSPRLHIVVIYFLFSKHVSEYNVSY